MEIEGEECNALDTLKINTTSLNATGGVGTISSDMMQ